MKYNPEVTNYISQFPVDVQLILNQLRKLVHTSNSAIKESHSYGMVGCKLYGKPLIYFGAFKNHIGIYPTPSGITKFKKELKPYVSAKGSAQFPLSDPFPYDLFTQILNYKITELKEKYEK